MYEVHRKVKLSDGTRLLEIETVHVGGFETQSTYEYKRPGLGTTFSKKGYKLGYWGNIEEAVQDNDEAKELRDRLRTI